jgi:hypothetical protein
MSSKKLRRFVVTFQEEFPMELIQGMLESNFMGLGKTFSGKDPRILFLYPFPDVANTVLKSTLDELQTGGDLTYVEEHR